MSDEYSTQSKRRKRRHWVYHFIRNGFLSTLAVSVIVFVTYLTGSTLDRGFSDNMLFLLLRLLRYSSLLLSAFSVIAMGFSVVRLVYRPRVGITLLLIFCFITGILGAGLAILSSLIIATTGGYE